MDFAEAHARSSSYRLKQKTNRPTHVVREWADSVVALVLGLPVHTRQEIGVGFRLREPVNQQLD